MADAKRVAGVVVLGGLLFGMCATGAKADEEPSERELLDELKNDYTIVIVTHNMQQAARVSQRTAFFHLGNLVEDGPTEVIFNNPKDRRTQDYITGRFG